MSRDFSIGRKVDAENRQFQDKWTKNYYFVMNKGFPMCLLCYESLSVVKEYNMKRHFTCKHGDRKNFDEKQINDKIDTLKNNFDNRKEIINKAKIQNYKRVKSSFLVSEKIAKHSKSFKEGEFIKECLLDISNVICPEYKNDYESICLSRRTVVRRINMMACDIKKTLKEQISRLKSFSIALDESIDASDTAQLAVFLRGVDINFNIIEELLALHSFRGTTTGEDIFEAINSIFEKYGLKWSSLSGICTDGAPSMVGVKKGFIGVVSQKAIDLQIVSENLTNFHCIIHQQSLCAKSLKFKNVMEVVVGCINFIKSRALNHRQFKEYLEDIFSEYEDVSYYTEVRWLSKGKMLKRFYDLRQEIADFLDIKGYKTKEIKNADWLNDLAFLVDVTGYLNELNIKLQKQGQLVHQLHGHVKAFTNKLRLLERQIRAKNCFHFPTLATHTNIPFDCYGDELKSLIDQFDMRFIDFQNKDLAFTIFARPLDVDINCVPEHLQMELIELQADLVIKSKFNHIDLIDFYKFCLTEEKYKNLRIFSRSIISLCGCRYICE
ncbi:General transcription factor II-I repeat domain-containing protein 2 [Thelohanellus kitauei]|uniref:General transcription factor II-I repeat domain-containing protein 2 n=1 Tax=Thelohanellus kitauei TaxID=669202 RepID=A0A0C2MRZ2_THEKT|nr:General transcription factor II-I repeat domain-containing protein 2 [Thelohanellus kitauei]